MMPIAFKTPAVSAEDTKRAESLVKQMTALATKLSHWGRQSRNRYALLSPANRQQLLAEGFPALLVSNVAFLTEQIQAHYGGQCVPQDLLMVGFTPAAFARELFASDGMMSALIASHVGRCAYCESLVDASDYGEAGHYRPPSAYTDPPSAAVFWPGYFPLAYDPQNLFYTCRLCQQAYKGSKFPVVGARVPSVSPAEELPVLLNPYREDPRDSLRFNAVNGAAYAFDSAKAFFADVQGLGPPQVEQLIWQDPSQIPGQRDPQGKLLTNPDTERKYEAWQKTAHGAGRSRGAGTIDLLSLNRPALVRGRLNHLRQLRFLLGTSASASVDQVAANQLMQALLGTDPSRAALAPQYLSLSIDALNTWASGATTQNGSADFYNKTLAAFLPAGDLLAPLPARDDLIYLVLASELKIAGRRRIVQLSSQDSVYGGGTGQQGIFLPLKWPEDLARTIQIQQGGRVVRKTTLREFLESNPQEIARTFHHGQVWAVGDYHPIKPAGATLQTPPSPC